MISQIIKTITSLSIITNSTFSSGISKFSNNSNPSCPLVSPMSNFNTTEYIRTSWYIQQQQVTTYQPNNTFFCVMQTLNSSSRTVPFFNGPVLDVYNYGNFDSVNGEQQNTMNFTLCARQFNQSMTSELLNAPCLLPNYFAGPYWVLAAGPTSSNYSWAIISGGPPTVRYPDGNCSTSEEGVNGSGLWLFTRERFGDNVDFYIHQMRNMLLNMGYTVSRLLNVSQVGCNYTGTYVKH
jgi:hypothetical protein